MIAHSIPFLPSLPACRFKRWLAAISAVILTVLSVIGITAPTAQAAPTEVTATVFSAPGWDYANLRTGPGTGYAVAGTVFANSSVTLGCWIRGDSAEGPYGNSNLWYTVVSAGAAYISDAMVFTGSDEPVTEACSGKQPIGQRYRRQDAVSWAVAHVHGEHRYGNDCTWFISQALWAGGLPKTTDWTSDNAAWSTDPLQATRLTDYFKNYLANDSGLATITELCLQQNVVPEAQLGDVILYDYGSETTLADGSVNHAMIITGFSGQYPLVSGHSYDVINMGWTYSESKDRWLEKVKPNSHAYLLHITY